MKARILVLAVNDGSEDEVVADAIATSDALVDAWGDLALEDAQDRWGEQIVTHGFIDVEIPDDVIAQVLGRHADAGVVTAEAVE